MSGPPGEYARLSARRGAGREPTVQGNDTEPDSPLPSLACTVTRNVPTLLDAR